MDRSKKYKEVSIVLLAVSLLLLFPIGGGERLDNSIVLGRTSIRAESAGSLG